MKKSKLKKAKIVGEPTVDTDGKRIVYCIDVGGVHGNAWEYKHTGDAALAVVNFAPEIHTGERQLIWSAVNAWRAANQHRYTDLRQQL